MDILEIIKAMDTSISVIVLVYFLNKFTSDAKEVMQYTQQLINRLLDMCADDDD